MSMPMSDFVYKGSGEIRRCYSSNAVSRFGEFHLIAIDEEQSDSMRLSQWRNVVDKRKPCSYGQYTVATTPSTALTGERGSSRDYERCFRL